MKAKKEYFSYSKAIANRLILAQIASDGGKGIEDLCELLGSYKSYHIAEQGYKVKDIHILKAINFINVHHDRNFHYGVLRNTVGTPKYLVYFSFIIEGIKYQMSFHTYSDAFEKFVGKNPMHWDKKDSREVAVKLFHYYF